ncbi:MAG: hypothetical protein JWO64_745 [Hyphomicrobiales bacterium]|jgi:hypothetical protein|nr:hypothetical protein [Hyphomicrobiales bacterium]
MFRFPPIVTAALLMLSPACAETPVATDVMTKAQVRERLAACGTEWQQMKRSGTEGSLIWREFSKACMSRVTPAKGKADKAGSAPSTNENASPVR